MRESDLMILVESSDDSPAITLSVSGNFDFSVMMSFQDAFNQGQANFSQFIVDLDGVDYMDSSALGMLLHLKEFAGNVPVTIKTSKKDVLEILRISNFAQMFTVVS